MLQLEQTERLAVQKIIAQQRFINCLWPKIMFSLFENHFHTHTDRQKKHWNEIPFCLFSACFNTISNPFRLPLTSGKSIDPSAFWLFFCLFVCFRYCLFWLLPIHVRYWLTLQTAHSFYQYMPLMLSKKVNPAIYIQNKDELNLEYTRWWQCAVKFLFLSFKKMAASDTTPFWQLTQWHLGTYVFF